jgi:Zn-dependent dipeptidase, microsomal dipeptidase homolog
MPGVIDGHNDLPWELRTRHGSDLAAFATGLPGFHTDLPRLRSGGVVGQFWSVWVDPDLGQAAQVAATLEQIDLVHRLVSENPHDLAFARTAVDVTIAVESGRIASMIGVEGGAQIGGSLAVLRSYARLGARYLTLTWSRTTSWADSATDTERHGGLTEEGRAVVRELNEIGMIVDLAHVSPDTMRDALDVTTQPVMVSHSGARALCDHPRNVPDEMIMAIAAGGGVHMVTFVPSFLDEERRQWVNAGEVGEPPPVTVEDVADHLDHVRDVGGVTAVGLGGDYDGTGSMPTGLDDVSCYGALLDALSTRGWSAADLDALTHGNVLRVLAANDSAHIRFLSQEMI